jgi:hypothetical protein
MMAMLLPILGILAGIILGLTAMLREARANKLRHEERMAAIEKGIELPPFEERGSRPESTRKSGLIMIAIGAALVLSLRVVGGWEAGIWGTIPLFIGVALLVSAKFANKREEH